MLPLLSGGDDRQKDFKQIIADELGVKKEDILGHDLYLYNRMAHLSGVLMKNSFLQVT